MPGTSGAKILSGSTFLTINVLKEATGPERSEWTSALPISGGNFTRLRHLEGVFSILRYNQSIQEEWMNSYLDEINDPRQFNQRLREYIYFYNNQRVHESLQFKTPAQVVGKELICPKCV